jgi:glycosyltransferase involved in cell wall biosynthesis
MAHIAIDARKYFDFGIGSYIQNLISALPDLRSNHTFSLLAAPSDIQRIACPEEWIKHSTPYKRYSLGELMLLGRQARKLGADILHEPHYTLPIGLKGRSVVTIHDVIHLKMPQFFSPAQRAYARTVIGHAVRHAGAVIVDSQKTKDDILEIFKVKEQDVEVVHLGVRPMFRKLEDRTVVERFISAAGLKRPYVLYVGNVKPHKNISTLLRAFAQVRPKRNDLDLVFVGGSCKEERSLAELAQRLGIMGAIRDLHHVSDEELICAYNGAEVLVLPSLYEGFGYPVLEAMSCGTPTIVSTAGSLPEIAGIASLMVDPYRPEQLAEAILSVVNDPEMKRDLIAKGKINVQRFSWRATAGKTVDIYEKVLSRWRKN